MAPSTAEDRLRRLVEVNRSIVSELSLAAVLGRVLEACRETVRARYAALGVLGPDGQLAEFLHAGVSAEAMAAIGELPTEPLPLHHPPMRSFLGVPLRVRGEVFGSIYLADRLDADEFSAEDEELVAAIAATAGVAIENARLYEESRRQQEWLRASAELGRDLLQDALTPSEILTRIADIVRRLASADLVTVVVPEADTDQLVVRIARGQQAGQLQGYRYAAAGSLVGDAISTGRTIMVGPDHGGYVVHQQSRFDVGPVMACPLVGQTGVRAAVVAGRQAGSPPFVASDLKVAQSFTNYAAVAWELADRREGQRRLEVLEDRARIARDLHDHVIQRLFAAGLSLQAAAMRSADRQLVDKLSATVEDLNGTIRQIRTEIFALQDHHGDSSESPRLALADVVAQVEPALGFAPALTFAGPVDTLVDPGVLDDAEAVLREGLTNVAKHSDADHVDVAVVATRDQLTITITDNGTIAPTGGRRSGLANLEQRARSRDGALTIGHDEAGTTLSWSARLPGS